MEDLEELKELCVEYDISKDVFNKIVKSAIELREYNGKVFDNNELVEIIKLSVQNYDPPYTLDGVIGTKNKSVKDTVKLSADKIFSDNAYTDSGLDYDYSDENKHI